MSAMLVPSNYRESNWRKTVVVFLSFPPQTSGELLVEALMEAV